MDAREQALGNIRGGRVLDVVTGRGDFVEFLANPLCRGSQLVGVDIAASVIEPPPSEVNGENVRFVRIDAEQLGRPDADSDTVFDSASLHNLADASPAFVRGDECSDRARTQSSASCTVTSRPKRS